MSNQNKYLLENTPEAQSQINKIIDLLKTGDLFNVRLALQLLEGGGVPDRIWTYLTAILWTNTVYENGTDLIRSFMHKYAKTEFYEQIQDIYDDGYGFHEYNFTDLFEDETYPFPDILDKKELANQILLSGTSERESIAKYCLKHQTIHPKTFLKAFLEEDYLDLSGLDLDFLPKEIGEFVNITDLDISRNNFIEVPNEISQLKNLESLEYHDTPLSTKSIEKLKGYFPSIFAQQIYYKASSLFHDKKYEDALIKINDSLELDDTSSDVWNTKGVILQRLKRYDEALICFKKTVEINPEDTLAWSNMAHNLHVTQQDEESLKIALKGLAIYQKNPSIDRYWEATLYFRKGQALFFLNRLEESELTYNQALKIKPDYGPALYNKACIYAKWHQKNKLLTFLKKAISCDNKYVEEAKVDKDFQDYWQDEDFIDLLEIKE